MISPQQLKVDLLNGTLDDSALHTLLTANVHENENIDTLLNFFLQYIPGDRTFAEFIEQAKHYNNAQVCGLVWSANVVAYRCKTCSISPCMSICAQCFQNGNHEGHNFNMFKSQAGGACDCGDASVMHEVGFCRHHGVNRPAAQNAPRELVCCAELLIPHLLKVFIRALRMTAVSGDIVTEQKLLEIFNQLSNAGSAIQMYITRALTDTSLYEQFTTDPTLNKLYQYEYLSAEYTSLPMAFFVESLIDDESTDSLIPFDTTLRTMLDEIMMWCVTENLPEDLVRFLLSLLPDLNFKILFTETFLRFYGTIAQSLIDESMQESSEIPSRLVHISVQLFSSHTIAEYAMENYHLIEVILSCIWHMFVPSILQDKNEDEDENLLKTHPLALNEDSTSAMVVDVDHRLITKNVYWPLLSDFVNILAQQKIALTIVEKKKYFNLWLRFLTLFQGMNANERLLTQHVEYESHAYMFAFTIELEISAAAMWCFVNHFETNFSSESFVRVIRQLVESVTDWMQSLHFDPKTVNHWKLTFHLPLHRYLAVFAYNAIDKYDIDPASFLPIENQNTLFSLMYYPLRTICGYHEVLTNIWLRNGQQLTIQAKTYAKSAFSSSMHDADLFFLQLIACYVDPNAFVENLLLNFHVNPWLSEPEKSSILDPTQHIAMLESALITFAALVGFQPNISIRDISQTRAEIVASLVVADRLYSEVEENVPDPSPLSTNRKEIETILNQVADFQTPSVEIMGHLQQGKYAIKGSVFETEYDPLRVIIRHTKRAYFQSSLERFSTYVKHEGRFKSDHPLWPPYRLPEYGHPRMANVQRILRSDLLHNCLFLCLNIYLKDKRNSENVLYLTIYLLELSLLHAREEQTSSMLINENSEATNSDGILVKFYSLTRSSDSECESIISLLLKILLKQRPNDFFDVSTKILDQNHDDSSRIGDAYHFIGRVLRYSARLDDQCRVHIEQELEKMRNVHQQRLTTNVKTSDLTAEQKRQRAKNRQQKLLAEIAQSQKKFISQQNPDEHSMLVGTPPSASSYGDHFHETPPVSTSDHALMGETLPEYECCVCRLTKSDSPSPIGLIGTTCLSLLPSLQLTQLNEHQQRILGLSSATVSLDTYSNLIKQNLTQISGHSYIANFCQNDHYLHSLLIQSCGHSMHADCLSSYLKALHPNQDELEVIVSPNTNFRCPLCRQLANTLIPLFDANDYSIREDEHRASSKPIERLHQAMLHPSRPRLKRGADEMCLLTFLTGLAAKCVSDEQLSPEIPMILPNHNSMKQRAAEFDCGTLRAQLVHEQLFYESANRVYQKNIRKSFYKILHDLHYLGYPFHHQHLWQELTGLECPSTGIDVFDARQPLTPILLRDPATMFFQLLMSAPSNLPSDEFDILVQIIYNVEFLKNLIAIPSSSNETNTMPMNLHWYTNELNKYLKDYDIIDQTKRMDTIESIVMNNSLEFFKLASRVKYRLYNHEMPWIMGEEPSPLALANFLNLTINLNGLAMPIWHCNEPLTLLSNWLQELRSLAQHQNVATKILTIERPHFHPPSFVGLPEKYDDLFRLYNEYRCEDCKTVSAEPLLCLICGEIYLKRWRIPCCISQQQRNIKHISRCGHPTAVMLDIQTTMITVCSPDTYGDWHSLYLDQHGEEDQKLKRGKSLYLNSKRLAVLRTLWLTATFDYQIQHWLPYNALVSHLNVFL